MPAAPLKPPEILLAKRPRIASSPAPAETLCGHLEEVFKVSGALSDLTGEKSLKSLCFFSEFSECLAQALPRAALMHDLGKASHQFQRMIRGKSEAPQALRHEWISAWVVLKNPELGEWLFPGCSDVVRHSCLFAVLGHHLKAENGGAVTRPRSGSGDSRVTVHTGHPDAARCLSLAQKALGLGPPPELSDLSIDLVSRPLDELKKWIRDAAAWHESADENTKRFIALVKALLVAADVAGSALPKKFDDPAAWVRATLSRVCTGRDLKKVADKRLGGLAPRQFQARAAASEKSVSFIKAGCGSGKTVAAYLWAARRAQGRKVFFCYPTTGTATEGFRDYVDTSELSADAALLHSRAECDLEDMRPAPDDESIENSLRFDALSGWDAPLAVCTADRVLGLIQNGRKSLFSFPTFAGSAFVFDEIHQYDERMFGAFLRFLEAFRGAPVLLMTASLPRAKLSALMKLVQERGEELEIIEGPAELEAISRYTVSAPVADAPWEALERAFERGEKILWVANTVARAMSFAQKAGERGFPVRIYHSRFRYCDRLLKHNAVISAFGGEGPVLSVTTQVCEVSLDISADLLISDLAPVPALIQRMGRLNRRAKADGSSGIRPALFLLPENERPYDKNDLEAAKGWLALLGEKPVSQKDLAAAFEAMDQGGPVKKCESKWLDGGPFSEPGLVREAEMSIPVVRQEDSRPCFDSRGRPVMKEITRYAVPMPLRQVAKEISGWRKAAYAFVAPAGRISYSKDWGAEWQEKQ